MPSTPGPALWAQGAAPPWQRGPRRCGAQRCGHRVQRPHGGRDLGASPSGEQPEHIAPVKKDASGWPLWLSEAAGDALRGRTPRGADAFQKLEKIGSGTYNNMYKAIEVESSRVVALKKVRVDGDGEAESARFMSREIALLRRLGDHRVLNSRFTFFRL